jgi:hypothetical protein
MGLKVAKFQLFAKLTVFGGGGFVQNSHLNELFMIQ